MIDVNDVDLRCMCDYFLYLIVFACFRLHSMLKSLILLNIALIMASPDTGRVFLQLQIELAVPAASTHRQLHEHWP